MIDTANAAWVRALRHVHDHGLPVSPRGQSVREVQHHTTAILMDWPVVTVLTRKLNYEFMLGEAAWIVSGSDRVSDCHAMPRMMRECSDDGVTMAGAYGPRFVSQVDHVVAKLLADPDTRQATMTIWTPNPAPSKDTPCTVAMTFLLREGKLNAHVYMRSSDAWLGLPYDLFSFTMMTCEVVGRLRAAMRRQKQSSTIRPGVLYVTAASFHLYDRDLEKAEACLVDHATPWNGGEAKRLPALIYDGVVQDTLGALRIAIAHPSARWW